MNHDSFGWSAPDADGRRTWRPSREYWRDDVQAYLQHVREALTYEDFDIPFDLKSRGTPEENRRLMQRMVSEFGGLLQEWPAMVEAARELRDAGKPLMV